MKGFVERILARVLALQVRLYACQARLAGATDAEALHDLRIALRQLRSLLRPLRGLPAVDALEQGAAVLGRLSGPLRDREVLTAELRRLGLSELAQAGEARRVAGHAAVAASRELADLQLLLDAWPGNWRQAAAEGQLRGVGKRIRRRLRRQQRQLARALRDPAHDRHRLRLLIKRVRYAAEAYPLHSGLDAATQGRLKHAQSELGDWHDHLQWLAQSDSSEALQSCRAAWLQAQAAAERRADEALLALHGDFLLDK
ncbi:CHAD domain-containing protein [Pseudomonas sp. AOB-7]|uniref:CHAD domain-containing protein n=2 Tax=unclassified Pseudomonas TaxID=196821 RepID=UPI000EFDAC56|nr:CHAD domain-containing protein [Pseudomonas sp. AOB-7]RMH85815.1 CHAD domain-containing protein [Pseudomonas sp. AOB-7]